MKKSDVQIGGVYVAKVSGKLVKVKVHHIDDTCIGDRAAWRARATSLTSGREITVRSPQRLRYPIDERAEAKPVRKETPIKLVTWHDDVANGRRLEVRKEDQRPISETWQVWALVGEHYADVEIGITVETAPADTEWEFKEASVLWTVGFSTASGARDWFEKKVKEWHEGSGQ